MVVDDSGTLPSYSNFCRVTATPEEVILDFGLNPQPFATGRQDVKANQRIVMNFYTAKRLLTALGMTIQRHEQTFGSIELDVRRRAGTAQQQFAAAPDRPAGRGGISRLGPDAGPSDRRTGGPTGEPEGRCAGLSTATAPSVRRRPTADRPDALERRRRPRSGTAGRCRIFGLGSFVDFRRRPGRSNGLGRRVRARRLCRAVRSCQRFRSIGRAAHADSVGLPGVSASVQDGRV